MGLYALPLVSCLILAAQAPTAPFGVLEGVVVDAQGAPLAGVVVRVSGPMIPGPRHVVTDAQGRFGLPLLPHGTYQVQAEKEGCSTIRLTHGVTHTSASLRLVLKPVSCATVEVIATAASSDRTTACMSVASLAPSEDRAKSLFLVDGVDVYGRGVRPGHPWNTESYRRVEETPFRLVRRDPLSTFSIDTDSASYSNVRRFLDGGERPPADAVRVEEIINAFTYDYPVPAGPTPFSVATEVFDCPWQPAHQLVRVGLQARRLDLSQLPPRNLVFLVDVSGSMSDPKKLPLLKDGLVRLCDSLRAEDHVAIVVYAGASGLVLEPTPGSQKPRIVEALSRLSAGGGTNGAVGIQQAYRVARQQFKKGADNRVILCTDGDFNLGVTDEGGLDRLIEAERASGVFLTCLGFGMGNYKDSTLERLADRGNGHYAYIDSLKEMERVFGAGGASLVTLAKDVKLQVEFNPAKVKGWRLLGYENRVLAAEDFADDRKDAGELNAGHSVTALYEVVPHGAPLDAPVVEPLRYQAQAQPALKASGELMTVKVRYKQPDGERSQRALFPVRAAVTPLGAASADSRWAAAMAAFGMVLRESPARGAATLDLALELAEGALGPDRSGQRREWLDTMRKARAARQEGGAQ